MPAGSQPSRTPIDTQALNQQRANILGVGVNTIHMDSAGRLIDAALQNGIKSYVCVTSAHGIIEAQRDCHFRTVLNRSFLTVPDGMPLVWVARCQGHRNIDRVFGPDLMMHICKLSEQRGYTQFLYGGAPGVAEDLKRRLQRRFPKLRVGGTYTPPYRPLSDNEELDLARRIAAVRPHVMWIGLSTPKQERFMAKYCGQLDTKLMIGVGAAFDYHTGRIKDAPGWIKRAGLQWLHRVVQAPKRLLPRYRTTIPAFAVGALLQLSGFRQYPCEWQQRIDDETLSYPPATDLTVQPEP